MAELEILWNRLVDFTGCDRNTADSIYQDILERYQEPQRHYHNVKHLQEIADFLDGNLYARRGQEEKLIAAMFWHDAVYRTDNIEAMKANEQESAKLAEQQLRQMGAEQKFIGAVSDLIVATKTHDLQNDDEIGALFLDADMAVLAKPEEDYLVYAGQIRREYAIFSDDQFYEGRLNLFLNPTLQKLFIYLLPENERQYGDRARNNLFREKMEIEGYLKKGFKPRLFSPG